MEDQGDDPPRARPGGGEGGPARPGGGGAAHRRSGGVSAQTGEGGSSQQPGERVSSQQPGDGGAEQQPLASTSNRIRRRRRRLSAMEDQGDDTARARPEGGWGAGGPARPGGGEAPPPRGGGEAHRLSGGVSALTGEGGSEHQPGEGVSEQQEAKKGADTAHGGAAETIRPWSHFDASVYKPAVPKPTRIITDPRRSASSQEMWTPAAAHSHREELDYTMQLGNLSKSVAIIGSGLSKVCSGLGMRLVSQEEKDAAAAMEQKSDEEKELDGRLNATDFEKWKNKEEEEKKRNDEKNKEKERRVAFILSLPGQMVTVSSVVDGIREIATGSKEMVASLSWIQRSIAYLWRQVRSSSDGVLRDSGSDGVLCSRMGTGSLGLRMLLDKTVVTRTSDGRISVLDGFGTTKETISRVLAGTLIVSDEAELNNAIWDFKNGRLRQWIDIDRQRVSLTVARQMWCTLCTEQLTGLLRPESMLPEMALEAAVLMDEEVAVKSHLQDSEKAVKELKSCINGLRDRLCNARDKTAVLEKEENPEERTTDVKEKYE